ncbi:hypothetical protein H8356DRAFT_1669132 [Neocallimastix lanati (nom. inval.)]|nr:hypothetical protein H8356DRAFT_1669132 [Neocallimastix sp. JGI-2020a]
MYKIETEKEFEEFKNSKSVVKYAVILPSALVNKKNLKELEETKKVAGIIVLYNDRYNDSEKIKYSPDKECPNCEFGLYTEGERANHKWNTYGDGLLYENFNFPIFGMVNSTDSNGVDAVNEASAYNKLKEYKKYPLYSIKFDSFMYASKDSATCLSRGHCDPIGGNSVWSTFSNAIDSNDGKKIIIVSSQLDGNSLFHEYTSGVNSQIGGTVANLAIADALSKSPIAPEQFKNHIVFTFFSGESYGYSGSQRFVQDISSFECKKGNTEKTESCPKLAACQDPCMFVDDFKNITLNNIKGIIELNQLTCSGCTELDYFMHIDDETDTETLKITDLITKVFNEYGNSDISSGDKNEDKKEEKASKDNNEKNNMKRQSSSSYKISPAWDDKNYGLPPASSQSFLKKKKIPAVVISDFKDEFTNPYYHSMFDVAVNTTIYDDTVCRTADIIAKAIWLYAQDKFTDDDIKSVPKDIKADCQYVNNLMHCLSNDLRCDLATKLLNSNMKNSKYNEKVKEYSHYTGVFNLFSFNGAINRNYNFDTWLANFAILKSTGYNTTTPCEHIDNCTTTLEYPNFNSLDKETKEKINETPYSLRNYQCVSGYCIKGRVYSHPAYGIGLDFDSEEEVFKVKDKTQSTWTESKWDENSLTIFITTSKTSQYIELFIGFLFVGLTIVGYYIIKNYAKKNIKIS